MQFSVDYSVLKNRGTSYEKSYFAVMAFVAALAYVLMIVVGPTSGAGIVFFRVYYILGGALVPA
jgi:hypothetical protein